MLDAKLVASAIQSRKAWERVAPYITEKEMTPHAGFWWKQIEAYYGRDAGALYIDRELLQSMGKRRITNEKHTDALVGFLRELPDSGSPENVVQDALELRRHNVGLELARAIAESDSPTVSALMPEYDKLLHATELGGGEDVWSEAPDWQQLHETMDSTNRIPLSPGRLNEKLRGGVWPGSHIILFGRTDMGKTTLAINMAAGFLWSKQRVLYIGDEDSITALKYRMMGRLANMTPEQIEANKAEAERLAAAKAEDRLQMIHMSKPTPRLIEKAIDRYRPTVIFLDQIRGMRVKADGMTQRLEEAGIEMRTLLGKYELIGVSITQANDRSQKYGEEPPAILTLSDIDSSRTGLPGTGDLIIGVGADRDMLARGQRMLTPVKNKFSSAQDAKHPILVQFDTARSKVT